MEEKNKVVRMETSKGTMTLELYAARAPKTVERFMAAQQARVDQSDMQFFIMTSTSDQLDGNYTAFGHGTEGMDVLGAIAAIPVAQAPRGERSRPVEDVHIVKASEILD